MYLLLVEDSDDYAKLIHRTLSRASHGQINLTRLSNLEDAISAVGGNKFDAVLLDLNLPDSNGLSTFHELQRANPDVPIVLLSSVADESLALEAVQSGAQDYIVKGTVNGRQLIRGLEYAVERQQSVRLRDQFLAMLSHELRNPLGAILNAADLVKRQPDDAARVSQAGAVIHRQAQQMARLLDDLLDVARVTQGKIELRKETVDIARIITDAVTAVRPLAEAKQHELSVTKSAEPLLVEGDASRLQQIVVNLLSNAVKYTPKGGRISLTTEREQDKLAITVCDNGLGLPAEMLDRIFDLFVQSDDTLDRSEGGLGVGLTLVRTLVELHGGSVTAFSEGSGCGSEFVVRLPLSSNAQTEPSTSPPPIQSSHDRLHVLIVEDMADNRDMLVSLLEMEGYQVATAENADQALDVLEMQSIDVALIDIGLPGIDGCELAQRIRANPRSQGIVLVALTGYGRPADRQRTSTAGFDLHLVKPMNVDQLLKLLAQISQAKNAADATDLDEHRAAISHR